MASLIKRVVFISQYLYSSFFTYFIYTLYFYLLIISYLLYYFYLFLPFDSASHHIHAFTPCLLYSFHPLLSLSNYLSMSISFTYPSLSSYLSPCLFVAACLSPCLFLFSFSMYQQLLGAPTEDQWPGVTSLPNASKISWKQPTRFVF